MKSIQSFRQRLAKAFHYWEEDEYAAALKVVDDLREEWPGNAQLHILWASLVQLQDETEYKLDEAKQALQNAIVLEKDYSAGHIELGHYLDAVEDNPQAAVKSFAEGVSAARRLLIDGLLGQAKAFIQLDKREAAAKCVMEAVYLFGMGSSTIKEKSADGGIDFIMAGRFLVQLKESAPHEITELLQELMSKRPA